MTNNIIINKGRKVGKLTVKKYMELFFKYVNLPKPLLLPIIARSLFIKEQDSVDNWFTNQLYIHECNYQIELQKVKNLIKEIMGDIADDIQVGKQCSFCGVIFEKEHGFPVQCNDCYNEELAEGITPELPRATEVEI